MGKGAETPFGRVIHPPIDRLLLQALSRSKVQSEHRMKWRTINRTQLNHDKYFELIGQLRDVVPPGSPFWMLEEYWNVTDLDD